MEDTEDLLAAYKKVRDDFLDIRKSKMGSGLRIVRKNVDWFLRVCGHKRLLKLWRHIHVK